jgi:hypothetical protein
MASGQVTARGLPIRSLARKRSTGEVDRSPSPTGRQTKRQIKRLRFAKGTSSQDTEPELPQEPKEPGKAEEVEDPDEPPLDLVREHFRLALDRHRRGDDGKYAELKKLFTKDPRDEDAPSDSYLKKYIQAAIGHAFNIGPDSNGLVSAMLMCRWLERNEDLFRLFQAFLVSLLSAHPRYTILVLEWLIRQLTGGKEGQAHLIIAKK